MALEAAYAFDDVGSTTVLDLSGNGRHITLTGSAGAQVTGGRQGGALAKTGATMPTLPASVVAAFKSDDWAVMFDALGVRQTWWFRCHDGVSSAVRGILDLDATLMRGQLRTAPGDVLQTRPTAPVPEVATWRHYALTYERSSGTLSFYRDGLLASSVDLADGTQASTNFTIIDLAEWTTPGPSQDNLRVFSHCPTPAEVLDLQGTPVVASAESAMLAASLPSTTLQATASASATATMSATLPTATMAASTTSAATITMAGALPRVAADFQITEVSMAPSPTSDVLCSPWATVNDLTNDKVTELAALGFTDAEINAAFMRASELLWAFSGRQWLGGGCEEDAVLLSMQPVPGTGTWPYSASWGRCGCWAGATVLDGRPYPAPWQGQHIGRPISLQLPRKPVTSIVSVTVDGVAFIAWTLTPNGWLQRTDGQGWGVCDGDTEVTYQFGDPPPAGGRDAAIELGIEMLLDRAGSDQCRLPPNTVSVTRQGLTMELMTTDRPEFRTALPLVDMWLEAVNPYRRPQAATVWSPDVPGLMRQGATREV
jgi:hypothetical protein